MSYPLSKSNLILSASCENGSANSLMWYMEKTLLGWFPHNSAWHNTQCSEALKMFVQASSDIVDCIAAHVESHTGISSM